MLMLNFFSNKNFKKKVASFFRYILNSRATYILLITIILLQFIMVSIIFFNNKKNKYLLEQTNFRAASIENRLNKIDEKINSLQSYIMRLSAQFYRIQNQENK